ncbi:MAG: protein-export chaperone SecB [Candidatus Paceibacterota bacterium]
MSQKIEYHKFQLVSLDIRQLSIISLADTIEEKKEVSSELDGTLRTGQSTFDKENKSIVAGIKFEINPEKEKELLVFSLTVELRGVFKFQDEPENIDPDEISKWLDVNCIYLLFPYLREQVYSLTQRAGFNPTILPLITVPGTPISERITQN